MKIDTILEDGEHISQYLQSRQILDQYKKVKTMLLEWNIQKYYFKKRKPVNQDIYQFRINQKYRAFWYFRDDTLHKTFVVTEISDHQDY